jgi:hypothetical protein
MMQDSQIDEGENDSDKRWNDSEKRWLRIYWTQSTNRICNAQVYQKLTSQVPEERCTKLTTFHGAHRLDPGGILLQLARPTKTLCCLMVRSTPRRQLRSGYNMLCNIARTCSHNCSSITKLKYWQQSRMATDWNVKFKRKHVFLFNHYIFYHPVLRNMQCTRLILWLKARRNRLLWFSCKFGCACT